jgi:MFS family permease
MKRRAPLYGWLTSEAVSVTGTRLSMIALPWFVLTTTGSPGKTGLVALAEMLPMVLLKVLGGPVIDRVGPRRVSITCDLLSVLVVGSIPLLHQSGHLSFPGFLLLVALAGALRGPGDSAKHALIPALVDRVDVPMERATGLASTVERGATMLGALVAGGLISLVGPANALMVDAGSFLLSAALLAWSTRGMRPAPAEKGGVEPPYRRQLAEGWRFLRSDRLLLGIAVMVALTNFMDIAWTTVMVPVWAQQYGGGAAAIGLLFAVFGAAALAGAMCAAAWGERLPRYRTYLIAFLVGGAPRFAVMAFDSPLWAVLAVAVAGGFAGGFINPILGAVIYERIPSHLVGRVTSLTTAMCFALMPLGGLLGGVLIGSFGLTAAMLAIGAAYLLVTMSPAVDPAWRAMDERPAPAQPARVLEGAV